MRDTLAFGIDFDQTITANPHLFKRILSQISVTGNRSIIVTSRRSTDDNRALVNSLISEHGLIVDSVVFCDLRSKMKVCEERGIKIDIWIDDDPATLVNGH